MYFLDNKELITLFPTPLFKGKLNDKSLCDDIARKLRDHRALKKGSFEAKNFISTDMLQDDPEFEELSNLVMRESEAVLNWYGVKRDSHYISNLWGNITNPNHRHPVHMHPNCLLSGLIYITTPENCGGTAFVDPRPAARMFEPNYHQMNEWNSGMFLNFP